MKYQQAANYSNLLEWNLRYGTRCIELHTIFFQEQQCGYLVLEILYLRFKYKMWSSKKHSNLTKAPARL